MPPNVSPRPCPRSCDRGRTLSLSFPGTGEEHAKWSPVATAWYRLNPEVVVLEVRTIAAQAPEHSSGLPVLPCSRQPTLVTFGRAFQFGLKDDKY